MDDEQKKQSIGQEIGGEIGKAIGKEIGNEVEKELAGKKEKSKTNDKKPKSPFARRIGYVVAIVLGVVGLWVVNSIEAWGWDFILMDKWNEVVGILTFSITFNIIMYGVFILYDRRLFYYIARLASDVIGIYVGIRFFQVFPFDFEYLFGGWSWLNSVFPWIIILGIGATIIANIVRTVKLMAGKDIYDS